MRSCALRGRGLQLARTLLHLPADALQRRRDSLRQGVSALGRSFLDLRPCGALPEGEVHHHLASPSSTVGDRQPPRVVAPLLRTPLHPALSLVHRQIAFGIEGAPALAGVLELRPDPLPRNALGRGTLHGGIHDWRQILREVPDVREPREDLLRRCIYRPALLVLLLCHDLVPFVAATSRRHTNPYPPNSDAILLTE